MKPNVDLTEKSLFSEPNPEFNFFIKLLQKVKPWDFKNNPFKTISSESDLLPHSIFWRRKTYSNEHEDVCDRCGKVTRRKPWDKTSTCNCYSMLPIPKRIPWDF